MGYIDNMIESIDNIIKEYRTGKSFFSIPMVAIGTDDLRIVGMQERLLQGRLAKQGVASCVRINYNYSEFYIIEVKRMNKKITVEIPYEKRNEFVDFVKEVNTLVDEDGFLLIAVDNNPYTLKSYLTIETKTNFEKIKQVIADRKLEVCTNIGSDEIFKGMAYKQYNISTISMFATDEEIQNIFDTLFVFKERKKLHSEKSKKKKIFISYSYKDKDIVHELEDALRDYGLNTWIDKKDIDMGSNIKDSVDSGIDECDIYLVFLSNNTKGSFFAEYELKMFFTEAIYEKSITKKWMIIKLDDVDLNQIAKGLGNYLYYDFSENNSYEDLAKAISKKLGKL